VKIDSYFYIEIRQAQLVINTFHKDEPRLQMETYVQWISVEKEEVFEEIL
jgi:hypothetical protein